MTAWSYSKTQRIRELLQKQPASANDAVDLLGIPENHARAILSRLHRRGEIEPCGKLENWHSPPSTLYRWIETDKAPNT